jgi:hypothetical protein
MNLDEHGFAQHYSLHPFLEQCARSLDLAVLQYLSTPFIGHQTTMQKPANTSPNSTPISSHASTNLAKVKAGRSSKLPSHDRRYCTSLAT